MVVGAAVGIAGGLALRWLHARCRCRARACTRCARWPARSCIYGLATVAHGSGFLAVLVAGILVGDERAAVQAARSERFHSSLASLAEIVAFVVLGLTVDLDELARDYAWLIGLVLAVAARVRGPAAAGRAGAAGRSTLGRGERVFVLWAGLKGAVPILLGMFIVAAGVRTAARLYAVIFVVVAFSVIVQGGLVPTVAARLGVPHRIARR